MHIHTKSKLVSTLYTIFDGCSANLNLGLPESTQHCDSVATFMKISSSIQGIVGMKVFCRKYSSAYHIS